jgi:Na+-driven multidrug efflux pump
MQYALPFLQLMGGTLFLEALNLSLAASLRAHGATREVMLVFVGQNIVNAAAGALLIFGLFGLPQLGVVGMAMATVLSRLLACAALWWLARRRIGLGLPGAAVWRLPAGDVRRLLHFGLPAVLENVSWFGAYMLLTALTARMGERELATQTYVMQIAHVVMLLSIATGLANEILIGHLVGAGKLEEAYAQCLRHMKQAFIATLCVALVSAAFAPWLVARFTADPHIIELGAVLVMMGVLIEPGRSFNLIMINALRACGDVRFPVAAGTLSQWGVMAFGGWALGTWLGFGLVGVWCAIIVDEWLRGLLMLWRWRSRRWEAPARRAAAHADSPPSDLLPLNLSAGGSAGMT